MFNFFVSRFRAIEISLLCVIVVSCANPSDEQTTSSVVTNCPVIETTDASVVGEPARHDGVCRYQGIQYATAERFENPTVTPLRGSINATDSDHVCLHKWSLDNDQISLQAWPIGEEDCLFLNIYMPQDAPGKDLPVMYFIHGGAFVLGAGSWDLYEASNLAKHDVIIVTINYRLGPLGFFANDALTNGLPESLDSGTAAQGNQGIYDQIAGLKWVHDYIGNFGGDKSNITIFGESAGAMSVCTLMAAPEAEGLFAAAIMQSGSCRAVSTLEEMYSFATTYAAEASCPVSGASALDCMQDADGAALIDRLSFDAVDDALQPTIDGVLLDDLPELMIERRGTNVPLLAGSNRDEVRIVASIQAPVRGLRTWTFQQFQDTLKAAYGDEFASAIKSIYGPDQFENPFEAFAALNSDLVLSCPTYVAAQTVAKIQPNTFHYEFAFKPEGALGDEMGTHHAMELFFLFDNLDGFGLLFSPEEERRAHDLVDDFEQIWTSFAKDKSPSPPLGTWPAQPDGSYIIDTNGGFGKSRLADACPVIKPYLERGLHQAIDPLLRFTDVAFE